MSGFGLEGFGTVREVRVDAYTAAYHVSGRLRTRFSRVADILNQATGAHLVVEDATIGEHADPGAPQRAPSVLVPLSQILLLIADEPPQGAGGAEMRVPKRGVRAQLGIPPFRISGTVHVPHGSRPVDGLLNVPDRFVPMTDVTLTSAAHPHLDRTCPVVALCRDAAHVLLVADDERPDELLAEVLDEATAATWLREGEAPVRTGEET